MPIHLSSIILYVHLKCQCTCIFSYLSLPSNKQVTSYKERAVFLVRNALEELLTGSSIETELKIGRYNVYFYYLIHVSYWVSYYWKNFSQIIFALLFKMESKLSATKMSFWFKFSLNIHNQNSYSNTNTTLLIKTSLKLYDRL